MMGRLYGRYDMKQTNTTNLTTIHTSDTADISPAEGVIINCSRTNMVRIGHGDWISDQRQCSYSDKLAVADITSQSLLIQMPDHATRGEKSESFIHMIWKSTLRLYLEDYLIS